MASIKATQLVRNLLKRTGFELVRIPHDPMGDSQEAETLTESLLSGTILGNRPCAVPVEQLTWDNGFSLHPDGWNPYAMTASLLLGAEVRQYEASPLARFYSAFQPSTAADYLCPDLMGLGPLSSLQADSYILPWNLESPELRRRGRLRQNRREEGRAPSGVHGINKMGPVSSWKGAFEFSRLETLARLIKEQGYKPKGVKHIEVAVLRHKGEFRYVIRSGFHRAAVLAALEYKYIPVIPKPACILDMDLLSTAPAVRQAYWSLAELKQYIGFLFRERGDTRAASLGLA